MNDGRKGPKGPFIRFSEYQRSVMDCESRLNPYPSQKRILELADLLRLTQMQVCAFLLQFFLQFFMQLLTFIAIIAFRFTIGSVNGDKTLEKKGMNF